MRIGSGPWLASENFMSELTLNIRNEGEVTLPGELANSSLSLSEIGALLCFIAITSGEIDVKPERFASEEMQKSVGSLREKGVIKARLDGATVKVEVDLDAAMPTEGQG